VVIPTFNERDNIELLVQKLEQALEDHSWEAVFVDDDSPDGTAAAVRAIARRDSRIRCIQRVGRRGLSSAVIEGMLSSSADYFAVLDGDLQHDETLLPDMVGILQQDPNVDVVVGSRYVRGGGFGDWNSNRVAISRFATQLSRRITKVDLTDPPKVSPGIGRPPDFGSWLQDSLGYICLVPSTTCLP
jgi:dolichol-phosphate mannosyltransferase